MPHTSEPFVRVPTDLLEGLLRLSLTGVQCRIVLWVVRETYGWNRHWTPFTWFRIAKDIQVNRAATYRGGMALLKMGHLEEKSMPVGNGVGDACKQRFPLPGRNESDAWEQQKRCLRATVFRRAKDSKERRKTYIEKSRKQKCLASRRLCATDSGEI